jgi:hypothetical protein
MPMYSRSVVVFRKIVVDSDPLHSVVSRTRER